MILTVTGVALAVALYWRNGPRPESLPLATSIDGPPPAHAAGVIVFLHGLGGSISRAARIVPSLRNAGLPPDYAIVLVEAPFSTGLGHSWGHTPEEQARSRARLRSRIDELFGDAGPPRRRVIIAGFSQGAGVALDMAVEDRRIGAVASLSPCLSMLRGEIPRRDDLRILLAHGNEDAHCPVEESRSLAPGSRCRREPLEYRALPRLLQRRAAI